ncbi:dipeptide ABC transporter ATP binding subunit DppF [Hyphomicrobiales bacterium]|nr:dipeptide ABC transporter ATP binding subunit DppF [Hyphomicrobiales bacterium]CAH1697816.1 dipeptide ABC transporter ATP binding subunit DppF [Hyphomicrobiales bacterium]CAI0347462.1 dipeptide ABC transporter ATP binding subunit DppF [Hyphomicrobiales bacterium]
MTTAMLDVRDVSKIFPISRGMFRGDAKLTAVGGVSLSVAPGEVLGIVGESGCGKTTLSQIMLGLLSPTTGEVLIDGERLGSLGRLDIARRVQPIFQDPYSSLNPRQTIAEIVSVPLAVHGVGSSADRAREAARMLDLVGLPARFLDRLPSQLSGGQRQRVAIARALVLKPRLLVCDEPTSALDVSIQAQVLNLLADLRAELGLTFVVISHNLSVVEYFSDRIAVMYLGRIVEEGPSAAIFATPQHPYTQALIDSALPIDPGAGIPELGLGQTYPDPINPPDGCAFNPRCPVVRPDCASRAPALESCGTGRVACHYPLHRDAAPASAAQEHISEGRT